MWRHLCGAGGSGVGKDGEKAFWVVNLRPKIFIYEIIKNILLNNKRIHFLE